MSGADEEMDLAAFVARYRGEGDTAEQAFRNADVRCTECGGPMSIIGSEDLDEADPNFARTELEIRCDECGKELLAISRVVSDN